MHSGTQVDTWNSHMQYINTQTHAHTHARTHTSASSSTQKSVDCKSRKSKHTAQAAKGHQDNAFTIDFQRPLSPSNTLVTSPCGVMTKLSEQAFDRIYHIAKI